MSDVDKPRLVLYRDRVAIVGETGSGKSEFLRWLFEQTRCRRLFVDPKHSWTMRGVEVVHQVADVDWRAPVIHVQPPWFDRSFSDELYLAARRRLPPLGPSVVFTDEAYGVSSDTWHGSGVATLQTQGREPQIGHVAAIQRPVNVNRELYTEATHLIVFNGLDDDDLKTLRRGFTWLPLEQLRELFYALPRYGYLWVDRPNRRVDVGDPLPGEHRQLGLLRRKSAG